MYYRIGIGQSGTRFYLTALSWREISSYSVSQEPIPSYIFYKQTYKYERWVCGNWGLAVGTHSS